MLWSPVLSSCSKKKIHKIVLAHRKLKLRAIAEELKTLEHSKFAILHEHLSMSKQCSKWIPRLFTVDKKLQRIDVSERCLELFKRNKQSGKATKNSNICSLGYGLVFCHAYGILSTHYFEKSKIINSNYYMALLYRMSEELKKERL